MILLLLLQSVVSGVIPLEGTATDASGIKYVQWAIMPESINQKNPGGGYNDFIGPRLTVAPYHLDLDTRTLSNGPHTVFMHVIDNAYPTDPNYGNRAMDTRVVMVQNAGLLTYLLAPCRIVDTRDATFLAPFGKPSIPGGGVRTYPMQASPRCPIPVTAQAYVFNVTIAPPTLGTFVDFVTIWPTGLPRPFASIINDYLGTVQNNLAIIPAGTNGQIDVYASQTVDVILDMVGYLAP